MIIKFFVENFRSIRERTGMEMNKTRLRGNEENYFSISNSVKLLKSAVFYGPNASGKSNFLRAFKALEYLVNQSSKFKPDDKIDPYEPHRLEKSYIDLPVTFEVIFIWNKIKYDYQVSFTDRIIMSENLYHYPNDVKALLYQRRHNEEIKFGDSYKGSKKAIEKLLLDNQLFISKAAENNVESILEPYKFFSDGLMVFPFINEYRENNLSRLYAKRLAEERNTSFSNRFNNLICSLDTGISEVKAEKVDWENIKFPVDVNEEIRREIQERFEYDIRTKHLVYKGEKHVDYDFFPLEWESKGTRSLFVIGGIILDALETGRVLIVDEFEKNLHPNITKYLIKLFHSPITNPNNSQLLFATHDISQLSSDLFRRDQIWFTQKSEFGSSELYRCSNINGVRLETPLEKWYESGKFGATHIIDDVDFLISMQEDEET